MNDDCCVMSVAEDINGRRTRDEKKFQRGCTNHGENNKCSSFDDKSQYRDDIADQDIKRRENGTQCLCDSDFCNDQPIGKDGEPYGSTHEDGVDTTTDDNSGGGGGNVGKSEGDEASERSVSVSFTVMSLVVTAAQFLRSL